MTKEGSMIKKIILLSVTILVCTVFAIPNPTRLNNVLLIPEWNTDSIYKFDPYNGTPLGSFCKVPVAGSPKNAIQGPDGNVYVSDQVADAVYIFDTLGAYLGTYADASDGLDNIRGIAFRGDHLFVCCYHGTASLRVVKEFSAPHTFFRNFIATYSGIDPFDILFLPDGRALFADAGTSDKIALHDTNGAYLSTVYGRSGQWPQQLQTDPLLPGAFLSCLWDADSIIDFDLNGTIVAACTLTYIKGVYRLGDSTLLATCNRGMYKINSVTGTYTLLNTVTGWQYIELYSRGSGILENKVNVLPLIQNISVYPNPFVSQTAIRYSLNANENVRLSVYDVSGKLVRTLVNHEQPLGNYSIIWDGRDNREEKIGSGIYFIAISTGKESWQYKIINSH